MIARCVRQFAAVGALVSVLTLTGCAGVVGSSVAMVPAEDAAAPECAEVTVRLPDELAGLERRTTNAQATGAWGNPAAVLLRCGVPTPGPTPNRCISLNNIDWVEDDSAAPRYVYTSYGRTPAVEVVIDADSGVSGTGALMGLEDAVAMLPKTGGCVGADDVFATPNS